MTFSHATTWTGRTLTAGDLRMLADAAEDLADNEPIHVTVAPTYSNPLDPGGEITIRVTKPGRTLAVGAE